MKQISVPRFHAPPVFGVRPGSDFFLALPAEGRELSFHCVNPPPGTVFDSRRGTLSGRVALPGSYPLKFEAENRAGHDECCITLIAGEAIQLTPPMGWNSWYCFSEGVSDSRIRETASALVERGLAAHGWNSVNIDDCWQGGRGGKFNALQGNERFPDMKALADYIHQLGLRFGIYSTPWIGTYAGFRGGSSDGGGEQALYLPEQERLQPGQVFGRYPQLHEKKVDRVGRDWLFGNDVRQWREWGVDFVKVDWHPNDLATTERIAGELRGCGRDIVLSLSNNASAADAAGLLQHAQLCRNTGDIRDTWESISAIGFEFAAPWLRALGPGRYPDPDMLQIGAIGIPNRPNPVYTPTRLSLSEQRVQFSLWCLLSAPLLLSCDIAGMDDGTFRLLTNRKLLAINQDPLVAAPEIERRDNGILLYRKPLADGSTALGIFNRGDEPQRCRLTLDGNAEELWSGETATDKELTIPPRDTQVYRLPNGR